MRLLTPLLAASTTLAAGRFCTAYPLVPTDPAMLIAPAGVSLLLGLLLGWRAISGVVAGVATAGWWAGLPALDIALVVVGAGGQAALAAGGRRVLSAGESVRAAEMSMLLLVVSGLSATRGLITFAGWVMLGRSAPATAGLTAAALEWAVAVALCPALLVWRRPMMSGARWAEFAIILLLTAASTQFTLSGSTSFHMPPPLPAVTWFLALSAWASLRFHLAGSTGVAAVIALVVTANAITRGGFPLPDRPLELLAAVGVIAAVQHLLAAAAGERGGSAREIDRLHAELREQHAALELQERDGAAKRAFLEAVLAQLPAGVMIVGPDGRILERNDRHRRMFATESAERLRDLPQGRMSTTQTHRVPYDRWPIVRALRDGQTTEGYSARVQTQDGQWADVNLCAAPVRGPSGGVIGAVSVMTDVTERNKVVRELRQNEQKLRIALQAAHMIVVEWHTADGRISRPDELAGWLGLLPDHRLETLDDVLKLIHPDHVGPLGDKVAALMAGAPRCETVFRLKDAAPGRPTWVLSRSLALTDDTGRSSGVVSSVLVDVSERYRQLDQLRLLESAVVHARDAVIILENKPQSGGGGRSVLYVNAAFAQMSGYQPLEVIGRSLHFLRGPNSDPDTLEQLRDALDARRAFQCELLNYRKDGSEFWVELSVVPVPDPSGNCSHWVMIQRDVSDRKRAETELRQSREMLADAQRIAHVGSWEYRVASGEARWSDEMYRIFGRPVGGVTPSLSLYLDAVHPDDRVRVARRVQDDLTRPHPAPQQHELRVVRPGGEVRHLTEQYYVECDDTGRPTAVRGVTQDVTDRRHAQEQLIQAQKMELIGQMAGGIAHDFNNLLTGVIGNLDMIQLPAGDPNRRLVDTAVKAAFRATDMTRKLLGFARKSQLRTAPVPLCPIVSEVVEFVGRTTDPRIRLRADVRTPARVEGDTTLLSQVLLNLCLNSRDAMPHGGTIELTATDAVFPPHAPAANGRTGEFVRLTVSDTGTGMTGEVRARIFEPFFTTKPVGEGTGLGLAMVAGIIEQHRGWVECDTAVGRGTRFDLYLPRYADPAALDPALAPPPLSERRPVHHTPMPGLPRPSRTVLLVDDEEMIRDLARAVLEANGYRVLEACDGEQAIDLFQSEPDPIDLVILDLTMPKMSGQDTFRALVDIDPTARVLFSSGYSADTLADTDGSLGLLPKPYRPAELLAVVNAVFDEQPFAMNV